MNDGVITGHDLRNIGKTDLLFDSSKVHLPHSGPVSLINFKHLAGHS
jgi:hypothetical protein